MPPDTIHKTSTPMSKKIISYTIAALVLLLIFLVPTFFGVYDWKDAITFTVGGLIADIIGRKFFLNGKL